MPLICGPPFLSMLLLQRSYRSLAVKSVRCFSTATRAVDLAFEKYPTAKATKPPIVICHGLFGSKQNWNSLAKAMSSRFSRDVYAVDLRNHGDSPHSEVHTYEAMSADLLQFLDTHQLKDTVLLGHSMGGKAVMMTALRQPEIVSKLVVVDMPPVSLYLSRNFGNYVDAMREIEQANPSRQSEADKILAKYEPNVGIRMFLLTNLRRQKDDRLKFRVPYEILGRSLDQIGSFESASGVFNKPTLFIAGGKSPYYPPFKEYHEQIHQMFPQSTLEVVEGAGHWVHAEKPDVVLNHVASFIG
ncbi:Alpha/Beta hydrolase protein [Radiomyces spectabilis]|uniref:Alpha/Beta hydrolase protein n=1 Tax=Radiomyces spectabilis TaxID=64574 RepID=UPI002220786F|nr:Alpha/Beta hydrolase protein [Radiomyces spectabilis]KAI8371527.1 Alpha/Beta hydrolase protein [Radiomyces spectabilis]